MTKKEGKSIISIEEIKKALVIPKSGEIEELILTDLGRIRCFFEGCNKKPEYTIGTLLPSIWFDERQKKRLVPVIYAACVEHRFSLIDKIPAKTVNVIIRDVSRETHETVRDMLKQALIEKEEQFVVFYS